MKSIRANQIIFWSIFVFVCLCFVFIYFVFPLSQDDWWFYGDIIHLGSDNNGHHTLYGGIMHCIKGHYTYDNSRVGNTMGTLMIALPRWINSTICSVAVVLSILSMIKLACIRIGEVTKLIILLFLFVFAIPWEEHFFSHIYAYNYIIIIPVFIYGLYLFINKDDTPIWTIVILGIIIGSWHESFAGTFIFGGGLLLCYRTVKVTKERIIFLISTCVGAIWLFAFPAVYSRASNYLDHRLLFQTGLISLVCLVIFLENVNRVKFIRTNPLLIIGISSFFMLAPLMFGYGAQRSILPSILVLICGFIVALSRWFPRFTTDKSFWSLIISFLLFILTGVHLISVCIDTVRLREVADKVVKLAFENRDVEKESLIFTDALQPDDFSILSLNRPDESIFQNYVFLHRYIESDFHIKVSPAILKSYRKELGKPLKDSDEIEEWNGYLISLNPAESYPRKMRVRRGFYRETVACHFTPFIGIDGNVYYWMFPQPNRLSRFFGKPTSIKR